MNEKEYIALPAQYGEERVTFQRVMKITLLLGQCFGLCPVLGICENNASKLRFSYNSGRFCYCILSILVQSILVLFSILKIFWEVNASLNSNSAVIFFGSNSLITLFFLKVAMKWPKLTRQIAKMEAVDPNTDKNLIWKCNVTCIIFLTTAAVEHSLSMISEFSIILACQPDSKPRLDVYLKNSFYWIWVYVPYNTFFGLIAKFAGIQCTFNWNYSDTFIMCICLFLSARLQQINDRINLVRNQIVPPNFWRTVREDYTKATSLVRQVDEMIGGIVLVSFGSNVFSICFLFLHILEEGLKPSVICDVPSDRRLLSGYEHTIYYVFAISFLVVRSLTMSLIAARVNTASAETAFALYDVPTDAFNEDVQRLIDQIHGDSVALSGLKFFSVKRGLVLTIAGAIVTYELVLLQFSGIDPAPSIKS